MKFSANEDIDTTIDQVFRYCSDFDGFERSALRRNVEVTRRRNLETPGAELGWDFGFRFRGKPRAVSAELVHFDPPNAMKFTSVSGGLKGDLRVELLALSRQRTRLHVALELRPTTISSRLMVQSMKLAKTSLIKKFQGKIAHFAQQIEDKVGRQNS